MYVRICTIAKCVYSRQLQVSYWVQNKLPVILEAIFYNGSSYKLLLFGCCKL